MANMSDYWLNVDFPTRQGRIHRSDCVTIVPREKNPQNGHWLDANTEEWAWGLARRYPDIETTRCPKCPDK